MHLELNLTCIYRLTIQVTESKIDKDQFGSLLRYNTIIVKNNHIYSLFLIEPVFYTRKKLLIVFNNKLVIYVKDHEEKYSTGYLHKTLL